ncbi:MAG TPA: hypothetical protein VEM96_03645 [Pyrinomonadaceae bacterium]|nr:hypothetical protein [Pyrinomonadaceae bacterium]
MPEQKDNLDQAKGTSVPTNDDSIEITVNKSTKEISLKDPATGRLVTLKANVIEEEDEGEQFNPLTPDEFRNALEKLAALGLTWTADRIPRVVAKDPEAEDAFLSEDYKQLQKAYPNLPRELSAVVYHVLTGSPAYERLVGNKEGLKEKVSTVRDLLLTSAYRSEFFFKYALKVPYFEDIDWEVVFKTHERNVEGMPAAAYALLLLTFHNTNANITAERHQNLSVAVDLKMVNKLIRLLVDVKTGLEDAQKLTDLFYERSKAEADNGTN